MSKRSVLTTALVVFAGAFFAPVYAQEAAVGVSTEVAKWSIITAGFALAFAAGLRRWPRAARSARGRGDRPQPRRRR